MFCPPDKFNYYIIIRLKWHSVGKIPANVLFFDQNVLCRSNERWTSELPLLEALKLKKYSKEDISGNTNKVLKNLTTP